MSGDRIAGEISNPQSLAGYSYVRNEPIDIVDPSGMMAVCYQTIIIHWRVAFAENGVNLLGLGYWLEGGAINCYGGAGPRLGGGGAGNGSSQGGAKKKFPFLTKDVLCAMLALYRASMSDRDHNWERGAAISPTGDGNYDLNAKGWTANKAGKAVGPVRDADVGQVHTHPLNGYSQLPSTSGNGPSDWGAAIQTGKPVFVLSKLGLSVITKDPVSPDTNPATVMPWSDFPKSKDCKK